MQDTLQRILIVDDDEPVLQVTKRILEVFGHFDCREFTSAERLLSEFRTDEVACVVADFRMPEMDGEQLMAKLHALDPSVSIVMISGQADVKSAVRIMEQGAVTLIEKPFESDRIVEAVAKASQRTSRIRSERAEKMRIEAKLASLTNEEREVLDCLLEGLANKAIAERLDLSSRTLDRRRHSITVKFGTESIAEIAAWVAKIHVRSIE